MPADKPTAIMYEYADALRAALEAHPEAKYLAIAPMPRKGAPPAWKELRRKPINRPPADPAKAGVILLFPRSIGAPIVDVDGKIELWRFRAPLGLAPAAAPTEQAAAAAAPAEGAPPAPEPGEQIDQEGERLAEEDAAHLESMRPQGDEIAMPGPLAHLQYLTVRNALNQGAQVPAQLDATTRLIAEMGRQAEAAHRREMEMRQRLDDVEAERAEQNNGGSIGNIIGAIAMAAGPFIRAGIADRVAAMQQRQAPPMLTAAPTPQDGQIAPAPSQATAPPAAPAPAAAAAPAGLAALLAIDPAKLAGVLTDPAALEVLARHGITL